MDTYVTIRIFPPPGARVMAESVIDSAFARMEQIDSLASNYNQEGEIARLHRQWRSGPIPISAELRTMLQAAAEVDSLSGGAFMASIGTLTELWGFGRREQMRVPAENELRAALAHCGRQAMRLTLEGLEIRDPAARIDLGGIAKGYAVDEAVAILQRSGLGDVQVDAGGDLRTLATAQTAGKRKVYVRHPRLADAFYGRFPLDEGAVTTSGDYERFFIAVGIRYHHILDPATGMPATACQSVTITGPDAMRCDALATAVFVLGPESGMRLIESLPGFEALILYDQDGRLVEKISSGLALRFERLTP